MLKIGLTGGIGSGKTTVARVFECLGVPVYYADEAAKRLMNTDETIKQSLVQHFGEDSYINGTLNRRHIADIVFADAEKLAVLNSITHPATIRDANDWFARQNAPYVIKEAALLFESAAADALDFFIGVSAPEELRITRVMKRDSLHKEEVLRRIARQMDEQEKMERCDVIIVNNDEQLVTPQILALHKKLTGMAADK